MIASRKVTLILVLIVVVIAILFICDLVFSLFGSGGF